MTDVAVAPISLDALLTPFEARPVALQDAEIAERRRGIAFGWELNRIQGAIRSAASERLADLFCTGRVTRDEYVSLAADLARRGLLRVTDVRGNGR